MRRMTRSRQAMAGRAGLIAVVCLAGVTARVAQNSGPPAPAPMPTGPSLIAGRVVAVGGAPVAGAVVTLNGVPRGTASQPQVPPPPPIWQARSVVTTADGTFVFPSLGPGRYTLTSSASGFSMDQRTSRTLPKVDLGDNDRRANLRITLVKLAAISGTVTDDFGEPAAGTHVTVFSRSPGVDDISLDSAATVVADDRGFYRAAGLLPGEYIAGVISVSSTVPVAMANTIDANLSDASKMFNLFAPLLSNDLDIISGAGIRVGDFIYQRAFDAFAGMLPPDDTGHVRVVPTTFYSNASQTSQATVIALTSGEERGGVDMATHLVKGAVVSGTLTGPNGATPSMGLRLAPQAEGVLEGRVLLGGGRAVTDDRGRFVFMGIPPGAYQLISVQSFLDSGQASLAWVSQPITVGDADVTGLSLVMQPGVKISGRIVADSAATSKPDLSQAFVSLRPASAGTWRGGRVIVSPDGTFVSTGDAPGRYFIALARPQGWSIARLDHAGRDFADEPIELSTTDVSDFVITITDRVSRVTGSVTDANGAPAAHASVIVFPVDAAKRRGPNFSNRRVRRADTTDAGTYDLSGLLPGEYALAAVDSDLAGLWLDARFFERLLPGASRLTIVAGEDNSQSLKLFVPRAH
jgi:protocatechuate 3,4-dioxygenase beta subunit